MKPTAAASKACVDARRRHDCYFTLGNRQTLRCLVTTLETIAKNRAERLQDYYDFRRTAMEETAREKLKRIVIDPSKDRVKAAELIEILLRAKIEVKVANSPFSSSTAHSYSLNNAPKISQTFPAGAYVIDLNQPQKRIIKALLEQDTPQDDALFGTIWRVFGVMNGAVLRQRKKNTAFTTLQPGICRLLSALTLTGRKTPQTSAQILLRPNIWKRQNAEA
jgi:hypothetical protein